MRWRGDMHDIEPVCPDCGGIALIRRFIFLADASFVGLNWCTECEGFFPASLPRKLIVKMVQLSRETDLVIADDTLDYSIDEEEVEEFSEEMMDNGAIWRELGYE